MRDMEPATVPPTKLLLTRPPYIRLCARELSALLAGIPVSARHRGAPLIVFLRVSFCKASCLQLVVTHAGRAQHVAVIDRNR